MYILLKAFPFMVVDKTETGDQHMDLILILLRIIEIVLAPRVTRSLMPYLQALTKDLMDVFRKLFPHINVIPHINSCQQVPSSHLLRRLYILGRPSAMLLLRAI